jgi:carboxyl-terminal processing protease
VLGYQRDADTNTWNYWVDEKNKIGYIRLSSFQETSDLELERLMNRLIKQEGLKGLVLDLRFNPGGLLTAGFGVADLFIDDGKIVTVRRRGRPEEVFRGKSAGSLLDFPIVCLVNNGSASASEIVSAALQDHGRALILGERSYGKGSVQNVAKFGKGLLKITIATFWRPSGKNLNKASTSGKDEDEWGVMPDRVVPLTHKEQEDLANAQREAEIILPKGKVREKSTFEDKQLEAALTYLRGQIKNNPKPGGK